MITKIIEGKAIKIIDDFHNTLKQLLVFSDYYGKNLDALWDCLNNDIETPFTLIWSDHKISEVYLQDYFNKIVEVFDHAENQLKDFFVEYQ